MSDAASSPSDGITKQEPAGSGQDKDYGKSTASDGDNIEAAGPEAPAPSTRQIQLVYWIGMATAVIFAILCLVYDSNWTYTTPAYTDRYYHVYHYGGRHTYKRTYRTDQTHIFWNTNSNFHEASVYFTLFMPWVCIFALCTDIVLSCKYTQLHPATIHRRHMPYIDPCPLSWSIASSITYAILGFIQVLVVTMLIGEMYTTGDPNQSPVWYYHYSDAFVPVAWITMFCGYIFVAFRLWAVFVACKFRSAVIQHLMHRQRAMGPFGSPGRNVAVAGGGTIIVTSPAYGAPYGGYGTPIYAPSYY